LFGVPALRPLPATFVLPFGLVKAIFLSKVDKLALLTPSQIRMLDLQNQAWNNNKNPFKWYFIGSQL
jgi:hypothetical protein